MEVIHIGDGIWLDCLPERLKDNDMEKSLRLYVCSIFEDFLMCRKGNYIYLVRA